MRSALLVVTMLYGLSGAWYTGGRSLELWFGRTADRSMPVDRFVAETLGGDRVAGSSARLAFTYPETSLGVARGATAGRTGAGPENLWAVHALYDVAVAHRQANLALPAIAPAGMFRTP